MRFIIIALLSVFIIGCAQIPKRTNIPVVIKPKAIQLEKEPDLPIKYLSQKSTPAEVTKAYVQTVYLQNAYIKYLMKLIVN